MLRSAGGDWSEVELQVKKTYEKQEDVKVSGKYVTEIDLQAKGWTTDMISFSKNWAKTHGYFRTSEVHGADEWRLPLDEEFANLERNGEKYEASSFHNGPGQGLIVLVIWGLYIHTGPPFQGG